MGAGDYAHDVNREKTPFLETEALLAVMNGDIERAEEILSTFTSSELRIFDGQLQFVRDLIARIDRRPVFGRLGDIF
jgi:hypothetical protein